MNQIILAIKLDNRLDVSFPTESEKEANEIIKDWMLNFEVRVIYKSKAGIPKVWLIELITKN